MKIFVGSSSFRGSVASFRFDLLELSVGPTLPRAKVLEKYRQERPDLIMSLRLHPDVAQLGVAHPDVQRAREAAVACQARFVVIPTGPRFSPSVSHQQPLCELADALRSEHTSPCWEPRSVFGALESVRWAEAANMILVRDLSQQESPPGPVVYTRLLPLGFGSRISQSALESVAQRLEGVEEAYVVIQGEGAKGARQKLREWFHEGGESEVS